VDPASGLWAFVGPNRERRTWKRYRGGTATDIWVGHPERMDFQKRTSFTGKDSYPMWHGGRLFFLSDQGGTARIWSMQPDGTDRRQHGPAPNDPPSAADLWDVRWPSMAPDGRIVFGRRADLWVLDIKRETETRIEVELPGDRVRSRVRYPDDTRRGVLGHGSVLLLTSMSARTSPVLRGKWVMEVLMGTPPPPPPPNIPAFEDTEAASEGRHLTTRERLEIHRANPTCYSCHRFMDPIGLALDGYDVTGRVRMRENGVPLDTRGTFYDGTDVSTPNELVDVLMKRPVPLVRNFAANLLAYALGRRVEYFDQPQIRAIVGEAEANGYRMSTFILGIVRSDPFQMAQSQATVDQQAEQGG
jgi:hypothetical protein